jgi:hypothetical protein
MKIFQIAFSPHLLRIRPIGLFQFRITSEIMNRLTVGLLGRMISSSQGLYLHRTAQHGQTRTNFHALSGIRTCDPLYEPSRPAPQTARPPDLLKLYLWSKITCVKARWNSTENYFFRILITYSLSSFPLSLLYIYLLPFSRISFPSLPHIGLLSPYHPSLLSYSSF